MQKVSARLRRRLMAAPDQVVALIVRTEGDPTPHLARFSEVGLEVGHKFRLLPGVSVTGRAEAALSLLSEAWIVSVEEDRPVTAT